MNLETIARIAEIVSSIAVVVSLIYVGMQVRQNTRALRATTYNAVTANSISILSAMDSHPEYTEFLVRVQADPAAATPAEQMRFHLSMLSGFRHWDNLYYQYRNGMLEAEMWSSYDHTMTAWLEIPSWRDWFARNAGCFSASLQALIRQRLAAAKA